MKVRSILALAVVAGAAASANALTFECRFVQQTGAAGSAFTVLPGNTIDATDGVARRIRLQVRVIDDADGPAPAGGFIGQNVGSLTVSGAAGNSQERRTNGRISPFNFAAGNNANGNPPVPGTNTPPGNFPADPAGADFQQLTDIDNTLGTQAFAWTCAADGTPNPQPQAIIRGRNSFVSIFEFTINPADVGASSYTVTAAGNLIAATSWLTVGNPTAPDCSDPDNPVNGSVTYAPFPTAPTPYSCVLNVVIIPGPGAAALLGLGGLMVARRRRA
ncbi:MAG: hypothetical protein H7210_05315 [Pyrinomonadaceae bacterium]|nr:hypothetical protein [Phycisphaerales bacterium]